MYIHHFNKIILLSFFFILSFNYSQVQLKPSIGIGALPNDNDSVCLIVPRAQGNPWSPITPGDTMADFTLYDINGNSITLSDVLNTGKRALIVSGSYTCPIFRDHMPELNAVAAQFSNEIECFVVYTVEAHPTGSPMPSSGNINPTNPPYYQPATYGERKAIVSDLLNGIGTGQYIPTPVNVPVYIDGPCNEWWEYYNSPNNAYLVDTNGVLFAYQSWFNNANPPNGPATNIWCDIDSLLGVNSGGCNPVTGLSGTFDFQLYSTPASYGSPGDILDIFGMIVNTSNDGVQVMINRMINDLPSTTWESSMCISVCLPPQQDTVSVIVPAGDTVDFSMHFFTDALMQTSDTGRVKIRFHNMNGTQQNEDQWFMGATSGTTSISNHEFKEFLFFPNPTDGWLYFNKDLIVDRIEIYSILGELIKINRNVATSLDLSTYKEGIYILKCYLGTEMKTIRVVKEK